MERSTQTALLSWAILVLGTVTSVFGVITPTVSPLSSTIVVLLISAFKVILVMAVFMELKRAPFPWQLAAALWVALTTGIVIAIYLIY